MECQDNAKHKLHAAAIAKKEAIAATKDEKAAKQASVQSAGERYLNRF